MICKDATSPAERWTYLLPHRPRVCAGRWSVTYPDGGLPTL